VLGHAKTVLVLLCSWLVLHEPMTPRKLLGIGLAVTGMAAYGHATVMRGKAATKQPAGGGGTGGGSWRADLRARVGAKVRSFPLKTAHSHQIRVSDSSSRSSSTDGGAAAAKEAGAPAVVAAAARRRR
jgi:hypothetical protein